MTADRVNRKEKNQNIQVFVRLRPLNQRERDIKSLGVIEVCNNREVVVRQSNQSQHIKKFTYDRAFGPNATQVEVYHDVVSPLIEEVLSGYNCTVFAYGQTGTGKTHTMVGESTNEDIGWQNDPMSGIIPRALSQLFDELRLTNSEYTVRVSYLELYNEELFDLLSTSEDNSKLRIYEDTTRKGSNIVNGLEEITVYSKNEVYKIMAQGQDRKRVASTLMNAQSSRSHTVFTIVIHMKENSPEGEELVKIGKLNLVDLAGSENISKAGSDNPAKRERARECVNINQSLLTLGRVITALVERHPHIPYRESKLTRLLQESLGGRTKTSIIATVSPGHKDLEETMSTLEYAYRAKNIQNKPEVNQKMTKRAVLKEYSEEIDRLKRDLQASREKNGVYLANDTYMDITLKIEDQEKEIQDKILSIKAMKDERERLEGVFQEMGRSLQEKEACLEDTRRRLNTTEDRLSTTANILTTTKNLFEEQKLLVSKHLETETALSQQARALISAADAQTERVARLHNTVDKRKNLENGNLQVTRGYRNESEGQRDAMQRALEDFNSRLGREFGSLKDSVVSQQTVLMQRQEENKRRIQTVMQKMADTIADVEALGIQAEESLTATAQSKKSDMQSAITERSHFFSNRLHEFSEQLVGCVNNAQNQDALAMQSMFEQMDRWREGTTANVESLQRCQAQWLERWSGVEERAARARLDAHRRQEAYNQRLRDAVEQQREKMTEGLRLVQGMFTQSEAWCTEIISQAQEGDVMLNSDLKAEQTLAAEGADLVTSCSHELGEGLVAIEAGAQVFSRQVAESVEQRHRDVFRVVEEARQRVESDISRVLAEDEECAARLSETTATAFADVLQSSRAVLGSTRETLKTKTQACTDELSSASESTEELAGAVSEFSAALLQSTAQHEQWLQEFRAGMRRELEDHRRLESRYLEQEYRVYSPTGKTPLRTPCVYPRVLAATSPHERILQRFRARRTNSDEDCVEVPATPLAHNGTALASDSETSLSDDSAVVFAEPAAAVAPLLFKSTSEIDIYAIHRKQGKENPHSSSTSKIAIKSRLRAPTSHKKALGERN